MAALGAQTVASSYEQLLHTDTDGGGNGNTLVTIKDGDNGTTFGLKLSTNKVEVIPSAADDANAFEVSKNDGTAVFTVDSSSPAVSITGNTTMTTADNTVTLTLTSTDADDNVGPKLHLYRNSGSPAANDFLGEVEFVGRNNNSQDVAYASINGFINDTTDGQEDGRIDIRSMLAGTEVSRIKVDINEVVFNDDSKDVDFRVESDGNANMLVVDANVNRVGIGVATPGSPLDVESSEAANTANFNSTSGATNITLESSGSLIGQIEFASSGTSQIVTRTSASLAFGSNNVKTLYITDDDRVGIGTSSPDAKLEVTDGLGQVSTGMILHNARNANNNNFLRFQKANTDGSNETIVSSGDYLGQIDFQGCDANNAYHTGLAMYAVTEGTPGSDNIPTGLHIYTCNTSGATAERMRLTADGKVGIGTTFGENIASSVSKFAVRSDTGSTHYNMMNIWEHDNSTTGIEQRIGWAFGDDGGNEASFGIAGYVGVGKQDAWSTDSVRDSYMSFGVTANNSAVEAMRIASIGGGTGAVLIGDTSQTDGEIFKVHGSTDAKYLIRIHQTNTAIASDDLIMQMAFDNDASTTAGARFIVFEDSNTTMGSIAVASNVDQIVYNTTSDERLKENIKDASSQLKTINDIQVREFKWKRNGYEDIGVIAQELEKVYPKAVTKGGDDVSEKPYEVSYSTLVIPLIKAVQELSAKVEALENA